MKELSTAEVQDISGAGYYRELAVYYGSASFGFIGFGIGSLIPIVAPITAGVGLFIGSKIGAVSGYIAGTFIEQIVPVP